MTLSSGSRLGAYEVLAPLGKGGMGEVYRAKDPRLDREVAVKVLPEEFFEGEERRQRFGREARLLAALNHPGIAAVYSFEEVPSSSSSSSRHLLVMELVEGDDLAQRIAAGPLSFDESLSYARQIAEALEAAHEKGIVHRDLKPANVKVTPDGRVKLLDFGLAKIFEGDGGPSSNPAVSASPTLTARATAAGVILGTAAYMSPEQARGKTVDKRTDVWAFGCVLYEMLTGKRAFEGETVSDVLAAVLKEDPDWAALPEQTPGKIRDLLRKCLRREAKQRLHDIADARLDLEGLAATVSSTGRLPFEENAAVPSPTAGRSGTARSLLLPWALAAVLAAAAGVLALRVRAPQGEGKVLRVAFLPPDGVAFDPGSFHYAAISPDGLRVVFSGRGADGKRQLWVTLLETSETKPVPESFEGIEPFWSPDGKSVAFGSQGKLKRFDVGGERAQVLCDAARLNYGSSWGRAGVILFVPDYGVSLSRVPDTGGNPEVAVADEGPNDEQLARWPLFLPDGRRFLYARNDKKGDALLRSLDTPGVPPVPVPGVKLPAAYVEPGWLIGERNGVLAAQKFDARGPKANGEPRALSVVAPGENRPVARFSVSNTGILLQQQSRPQVTQLLWLDRTGNRVGAVAEPMPRRLNLDARLSPDGRTVAFQEIDPQTRNQDIWILDLARGSGNRLTTDPALDQSPVWSADGRTVYFQTRRQGVPGIYAVPASGGPETRIFEGVVFPIDATADGKFLLFLRRGVKTRIDEWVLPLAGGPPHPVLDSEFDEFPATVSPDGRWLAYASDVTGSPEVWIRPFTTDGKAGQPAIRITTGGGRSPVWRRDGKELYFLAGPQDPAEARMSSASVKAGASGPDIGPPQLLFRFRVSPFWPRFGYSVTADGQRFLVEAKIGDLADPSVNLVVNWPAALAR